MTDTSPAEIIVHVFGRTDVGRTREHNEDCFIVADLTTMNATLQPEVREHRPGPRGSLFMVADGMGGAAAGEIASQLATEVVLQELDEKWHSASATDADAFASALRAATEAANTRIHRYALDHPENRGMGTTATIAGLLGDTLYLCQVGDSRGYLVRDGVAVQITKDQSLMQRLVDAGEMTPEEAEVSERRNIILQAIGPESSVRVDLTAQQVRRGDVLIVCSDGLSGQMRTPDISRIVTEAPDLMETCKQLIDLANENGGPDNITVIAARFEGEGLLPPTERDVVSHTPYMLASENRPTMPVSAAEVRRSMAALDADDAAAMALAATTAETAAATAQADAAHATRRGYTSDDFARRGTTPIAPAPPAASRRLSVVELRMIFGAVTVAVGAWLAWAYLLRH